MDRGRATCGQPPPGLFFATNEDGRLDQMRSAHRRSRQFAIDPAYSVTERSPRADAVAWLSSGSGKASWLYGWGDLEAYLFARLRQEALSASLNVMHPGRFRRFHNLVLFRGRKVFAELPRQARVAIYYSGSLHLTVNGRLAAHCAPPAAPGKALVLNLRPFLREGRNEVVAILHRIDQPPALLVTGKALCTDETWLASHDWRQWEVPGLFPWAGQPIVSLPHQERMPHVVVPARLVGDNVYDFGVELFGRVDVRASGRTGAVTLHPGESVGEAGSDDPADLEQPLQTISVAPGRRSLSDEAAFRYLRVEAAPGVRVRELQALVSLHPAAYRGAFACSSERLTKIWMHSAYTLRLCMQEFLLDGVKRDRLPWAGDLYLATLCNAFSFAEGSVMRRSLTALYGEDLVGLPINGVDDYSLYWLMALEAYVQYHGDTAFLRRQWPRVRAMVGALRLWEDKDGFLREGGNSWLFIDWAEIDKSGPVSSLQMIYVMALQSAARMAALCEDGAVSATWAARSRRLQAVCRTRFWDPARGGFVDCLKDGTHSDRMSRHGGILALLSGTASRLQSRTILTMLMGKAVPSVGTPYMRFFEGMALARAGRAAQMLDMVDQYWGGMLDEGATTFWEAYDPGAVGNEHCAFYGRPFGKSLCHAWASGPIALLSGEVLGIRPLEPGWRRFAVSPRRTNLQWACVSVPTPAGRIEAEREGNRVAIRVPGGLTLKLATASGRHVWYKGPCAVTRKVVEGL